MGRTMSYQLRPKTGKPLSDFIIIPLQIVNGGI